MRLNRLIASIVAVAMVAFLPLLGASASAAPTSSAAGASTAPFKGADVSTSAKKNRKVTLNCSGSGTITIKGKVRPKQGAKNLKVTLKRSNKLRNNPSKYKKFATTKTGKSGKYTFKVRKTGYYIAVASGTKNYKKGVSNKYCRIF